jgi:hypothetical protein
MASRKLTAKVFIDINGEKKLWYEIDEGGKVIWHLPKDIGKKLRDKMLDNIADNMSQYINVHPESALWGNT